MDEHQRELATNRLLEIIRGKGTGTGKPAEPGAPAAAPPKVAPAAPAPAPKAPPPPPPPEAPPRAPRPTLAPSTPTPQPSSETPQKRPGMGLLDKVLSRPATPPASATRGAEPPPVKETGLARPVLLEEPKFEPEVTPTVPVETPPAGGESAEYSIPDALLPLSERLKRRLKRAVKPSATEKKPKAAAKVKPTAKQKPPVTLKVKEVFAKGKRLVGIDIGTASIKTVELLKQGNRVTITNLQVRTIPLALRKNATSLPILQTKLLREMLPPDRMRKAEISVVISDKGAQVRKISIPSGSPKELINAIKFQIKKDLPFPMDVCEVAYRGYNPKGVGKQDLEVLAVDKRAFEGPIAVLDELDLLPSVITSAPAALRFLIQDYEGITAGPGAVVVVDIGASKTTITIVDSELVVLSRTLTSGGDDFTDALTGVPIGPNGEELTNQQAEQYKIDFGLPAERESSAMKAAIQMRPIAERISAEINRSLDFYRRERPGGEIKKIILVGGGSMMKRLPEFFAENIGVEIAVGSPTARLALAQHVSEFVESAVTEFGPLYLPVLAVALDDGKELNMVPPSIQGALKIKAAKGVIAPSAMATVVVLLALYGLALSEYHQSELQFEEIKQQLSDLDEWRTKSFEAEAQFAKLAAELRDRQADYDSIRIGEPDIPRYLRAISNLTPENLYLQKIETKYLSETDSSKLASEREATNPNSMSMESVLENFSKSFGDPFADKNKEDSQAPPVKRAIYGRVIEMDGAIYPQGTLTDVQLVDFVFSLENSGHFRDVAVDSMSVESSGKVVFRILCGI